MMPENGGIGVFAHEYSHNLGAMDLYAYDQGETSAGFWTIMADDWTGYPDRLRAASARPHAPGLVGLARPDDDQRSQPGVHRQARPGQQLPRRRWRIPWRQDRAARRRFAAAGAGLAGRLLLVGRPGRPCQRHDGHGCPVAIPAGGATLSFDLAYDIEEAWDFLWVQASTDGANWTTLTNANTSAPTTRAGSAGLYGFPDDLCAAGIGGFSGYNADSPT